MPTSPVMMPWVLRRFVCGATLALLSLSACDADEAAATEVAVTVTSHAELATELRRIRASVYESDAADGGTPAQTQDFVLSSDLDAGVQAKLPFSFAIKPGRSARFLLVVEGFRSLDPAEAPLVEQKQIGAFSTDRSLAMTVLLSVSCSNMYAPCSGLAQTCWPEARACGPLREASMTSTSDLRGMDAGALPPRNPPECPADACDPNYPCTPTPPEGYVCLGARADYPMPHFGSKTPYSYDLSELGVVIDRVTGLVWQRELPARYEGCSGVFEARGDQCTLDEAKRYCSRLQIGGRSWRLPSMLELASLIDMHVEKSPMIDREAFPGEWSATDYWSSSTVRRLGQRPELHPTSSWDFLTGVTSPAPSMKGLSVRCVSGVPHGRGTPQQRFVVDESANTVSDRATTLIWQRTPGMLARSLDEARTHCVAQGPEWRVPNTMEMLGILDLSRVAPALPEAFPKPEPTEGSFKAWTETTLHDGSRAPMPVETLFGAPLTSIFMDAKETIAHVRCVR